MHFTCLGFTVRQTGAQNPLLCITVDAVVHIFFFFGVCGGGVPSSRLIVNSMSTCQTTILELHQRPFRFIPPRIRTRIKNLPNVLQLYGGLTGQGQVKSCCDQKEE